MSDKLINYVLAHSERGACRCGKCFDATPGDPQPIGHTVDMYFFDVRIINVPTPRGLTEAIEAHKGSFNEMDPFDGEEHGYIEVGGWLGDQGIALQFMGLGALLGMWKVLQPRNMIPGLPKDLMDDLAGKGLVVIQAPRAEG